MVPTSDESTELEPERVAEALAEGWQVIDVREPYEWEAGHIAGTRHVELSRLAAEASTLDRERPVIFTCRVGNRSAMATDAFRASGLRASNPRCGITGGGRRGHPAAARRGALRAARVARYRRAATSGPAKPSTRTYARRRSPRSSLSSGTTAYTRSARTHFP